MNTVLKVTNLSKVIRRKALVHDLNFAVVEGEVFGFLGPNGAGKTTTIRMLVGLIKQTEGSIEIGGYNVSTSFKEAMRQVGSIVENPELYTYLTGWENLSQFARMLGDITDERIHEIVKLVHLEQRIHEKVKTYSLGMKQRLGIAQALLGKPRLLILDEPTNGLDPSGIRELREFVRMLVEKEKISVFISSHLLSEIEAMCDRVAIINKGEMIKIASVEELLREAADRVEWHVTPIAPAMALLAKMDDVREIVQINDKLLCRMPVGLISTYNKILVENQIEVQQVYIKTMTLEDLFMELTGGEQLA